MKKLLLAAGLVLSMSCGESPDRSQYFFNQKINGENVHFWQEQQDFSPAKNYLEVTDKNGKVILYKDEVNDDLMLEEVCITELGMEKPLCYQRDHIGNYVVEEGQEQFKDYLEMIVEFKRNEGVKLIEE